MKSGSRANALLVELLIVIIFFMFVSVTLVEFFAASREKSVAAQTTGAAILDAQNLAEELYGNEDPEAHLQALGGVRDADEWVLNRDGYVLRITESNEESEGGILRTMLVSAEAHGKQLLTLPSVRYVQKEVAP